MGHIISYLASLDSNIVYAVQSIGPGWKPAAFFLSYGLGYWVMIAVFAIALFLLRKHRIALELVVVFFVSAAVVFVLKHVIHADRPYLIDSRVIAYDTDSGFGMPSAHALLSVVILGWVYLRHPKSRLLLWGSIVIAFFIGLSRVYLGLHYPSQVIAGWVLGVALLFLFRYVDKRLWSPFQKKLK